MGGQAELLQRHRVGGAGREQRALPLKGAPRRDRRPPGAGGGAKGENSAPYLSKGRPVAIDGRLEWREWEAQDGTKRQATDIIADSVQFLGSREDASGGGGPIAARQGGGASNGGDVPIDEGDFQTAPVAAGDDDIPF